MKHCNFCGNDNPDEHKFCSECGRNLEYRISNNNNFIPTNQNSGKESIWLRITDLLEKVGNVWMKIMGIIFVIAFWLSVIIRCCG